MNDGGRGVIQRFSSTLSDANYCSRRSIFKCLETFQKVRNIFRKRSRKFAVKALITDSAGSRREKEKSLEKVTLRSKTSFYEAIFCLLLCPLSI